MAQDTTDPGSASPSPFGDLSRMFEQFKMPGVDMSSMVEAQRKDIDALVEANRSAFEAMQGLARTQTEMLTQAMAGMQETAKGMMAGGMAMAQPAQQSDGAHNVWQKMLADMKGLAEMAQKTQADAMARMAQGATRGT